MDFPLGFLARYGLPSRMSQAPGPAILAGMIVVDEARETGMQPLYLARIEDLGHGDLVKVDCAACYHVALLTPEALLRLGPSPQIKVLDLKGGFDAADAERGDELSFRSSGGERRRCDLLSARARFLKRQDALPVSTISQ
jgi:hypothetical protein